MTVFFNIYVLLLLSKALGHRIDLTFVTSPKINIVVTFYRRKRALRHFTGLLHEVAKFAFPFAFTSTMLRPLFIIISTEHIHEVRRISSRSSCVYFDCIDYNIESAGLNRCHRQNMLLNWTPTSI